MAMRGNSACIFRSQVKGRSGWIAASRRPSADPLTVSSASSAGPQHRAPAEIGCAGPVARQSTAKPRLVSERSGAQSHVSVLPPATPTSPDQMVPATPVRHGADFSTALAGMVATIAMA